MVLLLRCDQWMCSVAKSSPQTYHVVDSGEHSRTALDIAWDAGVVLRFVPYAVFLAGEASPGRLRASLNATEIDLAVAFVMFAEVAASGESCARTAARVGATPRAVYVPSSPCSELTVARRDAA